MISECVRGGDPAAPKRVTSEMVPPLGRETAGMHSGFAGFGRSFFRGFLIVLVAAAIVFAVSAHAAAGETPYAQKEARPVNRPGSVRMPAVAGTYYPADREELLSSLAECFAKAVKTAVPGRIRALVSPHAGYIYSGPVAASAYSALTEKYPRVMILAASHHARYYGVSVSDKDALRTPLGDVPVSPEAARLRAIPGFSVNGKAETPEHSLEVQLPFLQMVMGDFTLIPLLLGEVDPKLLARAILPLVTEDTLLVASTDLTHYLSYDEASRLDSVCAASITSLNPDGVEEFSACGRLPVLTVMEIARIKGWKGKLLDLRNSGDTTGKTDRVVGYAAIAFYSDGTQEGESMEPQIPQSDRSALLALARSAITAHLIKDGGVKRPESPAALLKEKRGCFVTLHKGGQLRGCIGTIEPLVALMDCVEQNAVNAAFHDPRFPALSAAELSEVNVEVSVLTVPKPLIYSSPEDLLKKLKPNVHGVILTSGGRRATFLPQVWEQIGNAESFLIHLCVKAGCTPNCWKNPDTKIETYEAEYFSE